MFIKNVTIQGFKSYHEKISVGPFHEGFNVILGRNGAGKSNFFSAIEFVLSDEYTNLKPEQRASLLYAGSSGAGPARAVTAYVELQIDNKSGRFPDCQEEFNLRRTINTKMDQYFLNGKQITRTELKAMLETAGLSSSNPYHIVKQGKISSLATCSDKARLNIVRDLAGANVYDIKREQSVKMFQTCDSMLGETREALEEMKERHEVLQKEQEDVKKLQKLELFQKTLEYLIFSKEMENIKSKLTVIEEDQTSFVQKIKETKPKLMKTAAELEELRHDLEKEEKQYKAICEELEENRRMLERKLERKSGQEFVVKDLQEEGNDIPELEEQEQLNMVLTNLDEEKKSLEQELSTEVVKFEELKGKLECLELEKKEILDKTGRSKNFSSRAERDMWINSEIQEKESSVEKKKLEASESQKKVTALQSSLCNLDQVITQRRKELSMLQTNLQDIKITLKTEEDEKSRLTASSSEKMQKILTLQVEHERLQDELRTRESKLRSLPGMKQVFTGIQSVHKLLESRDDLRDGYHGILLDLFSCNDKVNIAVEQAVGMKVFHHVVSSDRVATRILKELNRRNLPGVFNFIPINRIKAKAWPEEEETDTFKMVDKLVFDDDYEEVMKFVFGGVLVCRTLEAAVSVSRKTRMLCVTLEGEKAEGRGVLSGGYLPADRNKINAYCTFMDCHGRMEELATEISQEQDDLNKNESGLTKRNKKIDEFKMRILETKNKVGKEEDALKVAMRDRDTLFSQIVEQEKLVLASDTSIKLLQTSISNLKKELREGFRAAMSKAERERFKGLVKAIEGTKKKFKEQNENVEVSEKKLLQVDGKTKELMMRIQVVSEAITLKDNRRERLEREERNLAESTRIVEKIDASVRDLITKEEESQRRIAAAKKSLVKKEEVLIGLQSSDSTNTTNLEKVLEKKVRNQELLKKYVDQRQQLGGPDSSLTEKYQRKKKSELKTKLSEVSDEMKEFEEVNRKAVLQIEAFSEKGNIERSMKDLLKDKKNLSTLISSLDSKREEQMAYTYKRMVKNFEDVFEKIVPVGRGRLELVGCPEDKRTFSDAAGIQVMVTFTGEQSCPT